jgi:ABC-type transport system substrate-binding protein
MRRSILSTVTLLIVISFLLGACAAPAPTAAPTKPAAPAAASTAAPAAPGGAATSAPVAATQPAAATAVPAAKIKRGGTLTVASSGTPSSLDPIFEVTGGHLQTLGIYEGLMRWDTVDTKEGKQELLPSLAESWDRADAKTVTFKLRKGVKFHDGSDFNAEVAKWSLDRMATHPKSLSKGIAANFDAITVVDPYTLKVTFKQASALQLINLTLASCGTGSYGTAMLSKAHFDKVGEEALTTKPVSTGPMKLDNWVRDSEIVVSKFDKYWDKGADGQPLPYLDGLRYRFMPDTAVHIAELKAAGVQVTLALNGQNLPSIKSDPNIAYTVMVWAPKPYYYGFNSEKSPFGKNLKLRQAAHYGVDRASMAQVLEGELGSASEYLGWRPGWSGYDPKLPRYEYNLDKSKALMKEAGFENGTELTLLHYTETFRYKQAEMIQSMWSKIGIKLNTVAQETTAARSVVKTGNWEMHSFGLNPSPDPAHFNRAFTCTGSANWTNYCNKENDKCLADAEAELDATKRQEIYGRCLKIMYEDATDGGMYFGNLVTVFRKEVKGLKWQSDLVDAREVWLDK